jgi:hypothetical protein
LSPHFAAMLISIFIPCNSMNIFPFRCQNNSGFLVAGACYYNGS